MNDKQVTEIKTRTRTGTLVGWVLVAAAIVAAAFIARRTVWKVEVVQTGAGPFPAMGGEFQTGAGPFPARPESGTTIGQ